LYVIRKFLLPVCDKTGTHIPCVPYIIYSNAIWKMHSSVLFYNNGGKYASIRFVIFSHLLSTVQAYFVSLATLCFWYNSASFLTNVQVFWGQSWVVFRSRTRGNSVQTLQNGNLLFLLTNLSFSYIFYVTRLYYILNRWLRIVA